MIADKKEKKVMSKKKNKLPALIKVTSMEPNIVSSDMVANLSDKCEMEINHEKIFVNVKDMELISNLGEGQFGVVDKMKYAGSNNIFAVKKIRWSMDEGEQSRMLNDVNISMKGSECPYLVISYGAFYFGGDVWIVMEVFDTSLDKFYKKVRAGEFIAEPLLAYITFSIVTALEYLHLKLKVMHRDVKPSNVLLDRQGRVKVCDFGISGYLVNSLAKTQVGCQPYLSPERIDPDRGSMEYGIKSDVWSLGLTVLEVASRKFPYDFHSLLQQLTDIVRSETIPTLTQDSPYSKQARKFIARCLVKCVADRAKYDELLKHKWLRALDNEHQLRDSQSQLAAFVANVLDDGQ